MSRQEDKKYVVTFLPWLKIQASVEVKNVVLWPFPEGTNQFDIGIRFRNQLNRMFKSYKDPQGKHIKQLTVVSLQGEPFKDLSDEEVKKVSAVTRLVAFSLMAENDYYMQGLYFNSTHFQHFHQRFQLGSIYIAPHTRRRDGFTSHGGYKHGELKFVMPLQTATRQEAKPNVSLIHSLAEFLEQDTRDAAAIRQAIDWFFPSNSDMDSVSWQTEVIMMASSFEALLQVQDSRSKKNALMQKLSSIFSGRLSEEVKRKGTDGRESTKSWKGWWIDEFYWLRNKIVHGGEANIARMTWGTDEHWTMKIALYARVSTDGQDPEVQLQALRANATQRGWTIVEEFVDHGYSGAKERRPALDRLIKAAWTAKFQAVLVWRFDRFARSVKHLLTALEKFRSLNINFISLQEQFDTSTPIGHAMFTIIGAMAQLERDIIRERVKAGLNRARNRGVRLGRPVSSVKPNEVLRLHREGLSFPDIARLLHCSRSTVKRRLREGSLAVGARS